MNCTTGYNKVNTANCDQFPSPAEASATAKASLPTKEQPLAVTEEPLIDSAPPLAYSSRACSGKNKGIYGGRVMSTTVSCGIPNTPVFSLGGLARV